MVDLQPVETQSEVVQMSISAFNEMLDLIAELVDAKALTVQDAVNIILRAKI